MDLGKIKTYLNNYAQKNDTWSKWLLNENNTQVSFIVNYGKGFILKSKIILFPNLVDNSEGSFSGWYKDPFCNELFQEPSVNGTTSLYGLYGLIFSVTFDANDGNATEKSKNVSYKSPYGELPEAYRTGYTFAGWFTEKNEQVTNETIVANSYNHILYAHWKEVSGAKKEKKSNLILIVGVTAAAVIVLIIVVIIALFIVLKKKDGNGNDRASKKRPKDVELNNQPREEYCRIVTATMEEKEIKVAPESSMSILTSLYNQSYTRPLMRNALFEVGLVDQADYICEVCGNAAQKALGYGKPKKFTEDDAAAIAMYTYDLGPNDFEHNPYRIINKSLIERNHKNLQKASGLLYLLMTALRKLPRYTGKTLYRGVRGGVDSDEGHYHKGNIIIWSALSSTSPSIEAIKTFLARGSKSGKAEGTLFIIDNGWGYNIQPYSLFPDEEEILLEPERQFKVTGVISAEGLTIINLQMLDTPLSIPETFGGK